VTARCGDFHSSFGESLTVNIGKIYGIAFFRGVGVSRRNGLELSFSVKVSNKLSYRVYGVYVYAAYSRSFLCVYCGDIEFLDTRRLCGTAHTKCASDTAKLARERQFTDKATVFKGNIEEYSTRGTKDTEKNSKVKARALFFAVCGREVYHKLGVGETESAVNTGGADTVIRLAHGKVGKADEMKIAHTRKTVAFDAHHKAVDTEKPRT
jgi:hypothetical protein